MIAVGIAALIVLIACRRPLGFAVGVAALLLCSALYASTVEHKLYTERDFFGINSVISLRQYHLLYHGTTIHGVEHMDAANLTTPLSYYARTGPLGQLFTSLRPRLEKGSIAVIGLGIGTSLCYRTRGERWTIYEIDPAVDQIARNSHLFGFIANCAPDAPTILGDARLSLEQAPDGTYDLLILDAYSADYVPVHLLTREALMLYMRKMTDHGVAAFHISNNWFDLQSVLTSLAQNLSLTCYVEHDRVDENSAEARAGKFSSDWLILAHPKSDLSAVTKDHRWQRCAPTAFRVWTDDYSSLVTAIPVVFQVGER
jgi:spermidine synthase